MSSWIQTLKAYHSEAGTQYKVPRKGSDEYDAVLKYHQSKKVAHNPPAKKEKAKPEGVRKVKRIIYEDEEDYDEIVEIKPILKEKKEKPLRKLKVVKEKKPRVKKVRESEIKSVPEKELEEIIPDDDDYFTD